jgi:type II secretory pathway component PulF
MAKTAVVAGTATAVVGAVSGSKKSKQAAADEQAAANQAALESQAQLAEMDRQQAAAAAAAPAPIAEDDMMSKLKQLADLHTAGVLSDEEFTAAKAKILG